MLLIPVQGEPDGIRYVPWMTWAIVALNVLVFLQLGFTDRPADATSIAAAESAIVAHASAHPDVVVPPEVERALTTEGRAALEKARAGAATTTETAGPDRIAARAEMDRLSTRLLDLVFGATGRYGFVPAHPTLEKSFSSLFIHVDLVHLLGNLLFFLAVAPRLEEAWGRLAFLAVYVGSGVAADLLSAAVDAKSLVPSVGASGAISGLLGAFLIRFFFERIEFVWVPLPLFFFWRFHPRIPAWLVIPFLFAGDLVAASSGARDGVAYSAHVWGFVVGLLAAVVIGLTPLGRFEKAAPRRAPAPPDTTFRWTTGRAERRPARPASRAATLRDESDSRRQALAAAVESRDAEAVDRMASRLLDHLVRSGDHAAARKALTDLETRPGLGARMQSAAATYLRRRGELEKAAFWLRRVANEHADDPLASHARLALAEIARDASAPPPPPAVR